MKTFLLYSGVFILGTLSFYARSPFLLNLRDFLPYLLIIAAILMFQLLRKIPKRGKCQRFFLASCGLLIIALGINPWFQACRLELRKRALMNQPQSQLEKYGKHLVVGYRSYGEVKRLVEKGMIGGVFIAPYNIRGKSFDEVKQEIATLQEIQARAGRDALWIMSDQEGGAISKLSPLIPQQASLPSLLRKNKIEDWEKITREYAAYKGEHLRELGINVNLSPVVDLKSASPVWDPHSRISERALSANPEEVAQIALVYAEELEREGVHATLKHFPGLGRVNVDTHWQEGILTLSPDYLEAQDWRPFRQILQQTQSFLMLGHVRLQQVDAENPVSVSKIVIQEILRNKWGFQGILITDDFVMAPLYARAGGVGKAAVDAINAGVDLLLISYDGELYYEMMESLLRADREGRIAGDQMLKSSERLEAQSNFLNQSAAIFQEE